MVKGVSQRQCNKFCKFANQFVSHINLDELTILCQLLHTFVFIEVEVTAENAIKQLEKHKRLCSHLHLDKENIVKSKMPNIIDNTLLQMLVNV